MLEIRQPLHSDLEELYLVEDSETGLLAVLAVHSSLLGPAVCGLRYYAYSDLDEAMEDALRTAPQYTYRAALANIPFGGACAALISRMESPASRASVFRSFGAFLDRFEGRIIAAEDMGCRMEDIDRMKEATPFACGGSRGKPGDPSYFAALGVLRGIEACVKHTWKSDSLAGLSIGVMGVGKVGFQLCEMLHLAGAKLTVSDVDPARAALAVSEFNAAVCAQGDMLRFDGDVLSPCTTGRLLDDDSISALRVKVVAGSSNSQLQRPNRHARQLHDRGIVYAPDFAINAGGLYATACEVNGTDLARATILANGIYDTVARILTASGQEDLPTHQVAMRMAQAKLSRASAARIMRHV